LPLGGVGRIGMNAMMLGYGEDRVLLDCGVMFPDEEQFGVDLVIPSLDVLGRYKSQIRAIVITHGHEDHIGALPFVLKVLDVPVYATRFTAGLIQHKLREHGLVDKVDLRLIHPDRRVQIGPFDFGFLRVTHSIPDCVSLAIRTPVGNVVFTGDFKIEEGLRDGTVFDSPGFQAFGDEGVLLLMSDSTNSEVPGWSGSESGVSIALAAEMEKCQGRVLIALFASNLYRMHTIIDAARETGRYVVLMGRSLHTYMDCANSFTAMPFDPGDIIESKDMGKYDDDELCIICTGSQAEPRAALGRAASGNHPELSIKPTDTVMISARQIPGNERRIYGMFNELARRGAHVVSQRNNRAIHVSGHAYSDEQKAVLQWVRPKFFYPVHGEYTFLQRHADLGKTCGVERTVVAENGQALHVYKDRIEVRELVDVQPWYTDGAVVGDAESLELKARQRLAWNGTVAVTLLLKRQGDNVTGKALVQPYGIYQGQGQLTTELATALDRWIGSLDARTPAATLEEQLRAAVRKFVRRYTTRKPVVLPFIHWLEGAPTQSTAAGRV
jgi:ribonuclease J